MTSRRKSSNSRKRNPLLWRVPAKRIRVDGRESWGIVSTGFTYDPDTGLRKRRQTR